jgi:hypothetical protein
MKKRCEADAEDEDWGRGASRALDDGGSIAGDVCLVLALLVDSHPKTAGPSRYSLFM